MSDKSNWGPGAHLSPDEWENAIKEAQELLYPAMDARDAGNLKLSKFGLESLQQLADACLYLLRYDNYIGFRDGTPTLLYRHDSGFGRPGIPLAVSDESIEKGGIRRQSWG